MCLQGKEGTRFVFQNDLSLQHEFKRLELRSGAEVHGRGGRDGAWGRGRSGR